MKALLAIALCAFQTCSAFCADNLIIKIDVYQVPTAKRLEMDTAAGILRSQLIKNKYVPIHSGQLLTINSRPFSYRKGSKMTVISDYQHTASGKLEPITSELFVGMITEMDIYPSDPKNPAQSKMIVSYDIEFHAKPESSLRSGVKITDTDEVMDFDYIIPVIPEIKAVGSFMGLQRDDRVLFETADSESSFIVLLHCEPGEAESAAATP